MNRTIWIAGLCLVIICCLLATKMVLAAVSPGDLANDTTAALTQTPIPGVDTLSASDRGVDAPPVDFEQASLPLLSKSVRPTGGRGTAAGARQARTAASKTAVVRPVKRNAEPVKTAAVPCRQLDPIARLLASAKIGPRCQA